MEEASTEIPICWAPNFSTGVPILVHALRETAGRLPETWQIEIVEAHHTAKRDAPSGTALRLGETWRDARGGRFVHGREGLAGPRAPEEIGLHAVRLGTVVGEHRILLGGVGETIELTHRVQDRAAFASGAVEALRRLLDRQPGLYEWDGLLCGS
jgi:4-hydroxy-tetrahydrodipicolinate reductase